MWLLSALFVVFNYIQQVFPNIAASKLIVSFSANEAALGNMTAAYFYTYALLQIPVGILVDRFNVKVPLFLAIICSATGALIFSVATDSTYALIARIIMGAGAAFSFIGCLKLIQIWFSPAKFSTLAGITITAGMLGSAAGPAIAWSINVVGWQKCMIALGASQLVLAVLVWLFVMDHNGLNINSHKGVNASIDRQDNSGLVEMLCNCEFAGA